MTARRLLDLFCGAGGASAGYRAAGFDVVGVDHRPQPRYPYSFILADWADVDLAGFDAVHASPPCQGYSELGTRWQERSYPRLIGAVRARLQAAGVPYVIENVEGAKAELVDPIRLCGSGFGLEIRRHRLFEVWPEPPLLVYPCVHGEPPLQVNGHAGGSSTRTPTARFGPVAEWRDAMGIDWMTGDELAEAVPPIYTEWLGVYLRGQLDRGW